MEPTTSRLRKAFRYPTDGDSDDSLPEAMDEQEQETLIANLHLQNEIQNKTYTNAILALPLPCLIPYVAIIFSSTTSHARLLSVLSITSLLSTSWMIYVLPPDSTGIDLLDNPSKGKRVRKSFTRERGGKGALLSDGRDYGPVRKFLPYLNMGLCLVLIGLGVLGERRDPFSGGGGYSWGLGCLPAAIYTVALAGKSFMRSVDPEKELGGLRYPYKGA